MVSDIIFAMWPGLVYSGFLVGFFSPWPWDLWKWHSNLSVCVCNTNNFEFYHGYLDMFQNMCCTLLGIFVRWMIIYFYLFFTFFLSKSYSTLHWIWKCLKRIAIFPKIIKSFFNAKFQDFFSKVIIGPMLKIFQKSCSILALERQWETFADKYEKF